MNPKDFGGYLENMMISYKGGRRIRYQGDSKISGSLNTLADGALVLLVTRGDVGKWSEFSMGSIELEVLVV